MDRWGTDEAAIFRTLENVRPRRSRTWREYQKMTGKSLDTELAKELSGDELKRAQALVRGDRRPPTPRPCTSAQWRLGVDEKGCCRRSRSSTPATRSGRWTPSSASTTRPSRRRSSPSAITHEPDRRNKASTCSIALRWPRIRPRDGAGRADPGADPHRARELDRSLERLGADQSALYARSRT